MSENIVNDEKKKLSGKAKGVIAGSVAAGLTAVVVAVTIVSLTKPDLPNQQQSYSVKISSEFEGFNNSNFTVKGGTKVEELKTMIASPVEGYKVEGLYQDLACTKPYSPETVITENMQVFVKFELEEYTITAYADTSKTQVLETVTVKHGNDAVLQTPTKADDNVGKHEFAGWVDSMGNPVSLSNIKADTEVFASFVVTEYVEYTVGEIPSNVTVTKGSGETETSVVAGNNLHYGDRVKIVYTPSTGHQMKTFAVSGAEVVDGAENWYEITGSLSVTYTEEKIAYVVGDLPKQVTILDSENNKVESGATLLYDDIITITYTPTAGYVMTEFEVSGAYPVEGLGAGENKYNVRGNITVTYAEIENPDIEYLNYKEYEDGYMVTGLNDDTIENVIIPAQYHGKKVYGIKGTNNSSYATFLNKTNIKTVTIEEGVESIGENSFRGCTGLTTITIPNTVTSIGGTSFYKCSELISIEIPKNVTKIEENTFSGCINLSSVTIPTSVTMVGNYAFKDCNKLQFNEYDNGLYLENSENPYFLLVKAKDETISEININENTKLIHSEAFEGFKNLTSVTIPRGVIELGNYAFSGCSNLTSVILQEGLTTIGHHVFSGCISLKNIVLPSSLTSIGSYAFRECIALTSITIPSNVKLIWWFAFEGCTKLNSVIFEDTERWYLSNFATSSPGDISVDLTNASTNATYLKSTYLRKYFKKK